MGMHFNRAQIAIHRRVPAEPDLGTPRNPDDRPLFHYDIEGWTPGDQAIVPVVGDLLYLPGLPTVRVVARSIGWPHPGTTPAREGLLSIDLVVEAAEGLFADEAPAADDEPPEDPAQASTGSNKQLADLNPEMI